MLESDLIQSTSSWPFVEIRKLLKDRKDIIKKKNKITFQTGYGPSGLPHIGTFGEVSRTSMMINALNHIKEIKSELITFSDDMDGLRKVPDNIPNDKILHDNIGKPLTDIPDPFKKYKSFGEYNNKRVSGECEWHHLRKFSLSFPGRSFLKIRHPHPSNQTPAIARPFPGEGTKYKAREQEMVYKFYLK